MYIISDEEKAEILPVNLGTKAAKSVSQGSAVSGEKQFGAAYLSQSRVVFVFIMKNESFFGRCGLINPVN
jgi:hypothetical protein